MGQTNPNYPVFEVTLNIVDHSPHSGGTKERALVGDILNIRRPGVGECGMGTAQYPRLLVEGLEENEMARLTDPIEGFDKRRYCIPLERLKAIVPSFDIARALDPLDEYQPFQPVATDGRRWILYETPPLNVHGLIWDKETGGFI